MNIITLAVVATLVSLTSGIAAMARDREIGYQSSAQRMGWRIPFQAVALILVLAPHTAWH